MNKFLLWKKIKNTIDSCVNQEQLNVCRNMLGYAVEKGFFNDEDKMKYHNDLSRKIRIKRRELTDET